MIKNMFDLIFIVGIRRLDLSKVKNLCKDFFQQKIKTKHQFLRPLKQETYCTVLGSTGHVAIRGEILRENMLIVNLKRRMIMRK